ncbi:MAG: histidine kinase [Agriterribacter sp.]
MAAASYIFFYFLLPIFGFTLYYTKEFINFIQSAVLGYVQFFTFALLYFYFSNNVRKERALRLLSEENTLVTQQKITQELDNALLREKEMKMEQEKMEIENAFFQSQINPHFLYNTLNVLFSQALKIAPELATNISNMSEIIRYSLENSAFKVKAVSLQKELDHLQILIDINALRFGKEYFVEYTIEGHVEDQIIPPLVLITAVENAFKYGNIRDSENPLTIKVTLRPGHMHFYCRNKKRQGKLSFSSHNIGIKNLHYRLDIAFQDRHHIETINEKEFYTFKLVINSN